MSLSLTFWTFRCAQCMMSQENKGGRTKRVTSTARRQLSDAPVKKATVAGKKVKFDEGLDLGNIVSSPRRGQGSKVPFAKPPNPGKISRASSGNKRGSVRTSGKKRGAEHAAASPSTAVASVANKSKPSPVVRPKHTTKFLSEVSAGMMKGACYSLNDLAKGLGLPPFASSTKAELEKCLFSQSHAANAKEPFDPNIIVEALGKAFDEHVARSGKNHQSPAPSPASSSAPQVYLPYSFLPFFHSLHFSFIFLHSFRPSFLFRSLPLAHSVLPLFSPSPMLQAIQDRTRHTPAWKPRRHRF